MAILVPTKATQCDIKATLKRVDSQGIATLKPPQSHLKATPERRQKEEWRMQKAPQGYRKPEPCSWSWGPCPP